MKAKFKTTACAAALVLTAGAASAQELKFMCFSDADDCTVIDSVIDGFEAENPGITVVIDKVPYQAVLDSLPVQLAAGTGPDIALVTDLGGLNRYYLDLSPYVDDAYWQDNFGDFLNWYRADAEDDGIYGLHWQLTVTGPYINRTLFDQAGVAVPAPDATWDDWVAATRDVAEKTGTMFPMAMDRSGHRIAGPMISYGARYFDESGAPILVDDGFTAFVEKFVGWHEDGTMARDVWAGRGGNAYQDAAAEFVNGELVFYYSGSWNVGRFDAEIGDLFDWQVVGSPCGIAGCTGMPGGAGIVGFKHTKHPEAVAKLIDYLAQSEIYTQMSARTGNIPAHRAVAAAGVDYKSASAQAAAALNAWGAQVAKLEAPAFQYQGYEGNRAMFNITVSRVTQAIVGEMTVDEAMAKAKQDLAEILAETN